MKPHIILALIIAALVSAALFIGWALGTKNSSPADEQKTAHNRIPIATPAGDKESELRKIWGDILERRSAIAELQQAAKAPLTDLKKKIHDITQIPESSLTGDHIDELKESALAYIRDNREKAKQAKMQTQVQALINAEMANFKKAAESAQAEINKQNSLYAKSVRSFFKIQASGSSPALTGADYYKVIRSYPQQLANRLNDFKIPENQDQMEQMIAKAVASISRPNMISIPPRPAGDQTGYNARLAGINATNQRRKIEYDRKVADARANAKEKAMEGVNKEKKMLTDNFNSKVATEVSSEEWQAYLNQVKRTLLQGWEAKLNTDASSKAKSLMITFR